MYTHLDRKAHCTPWLHPWCSQLLLGSQPVEHVTSLNTAGDCNTLVSVCMSKHRKGAKDKNSAPAWALTMTEA